MHTTSPPTTDTHQPLAKTSPTGTAESSNQLTEPLASNEADVKTSLDARVQKKKATALLDAMFYWVISRS